MFQWHDLAQHDIAGVVKRDTIGDLSDSLADGLGLKNAGPMEDLDIDVSYVVCCQAQPSSIQLQLSWLGWDSFNFNFTHPKKFTNFTLPLFRTIS